MPRPKQGYKNAQGLPIPGCTDITGRFMDRSRLLYWAFNRGKQGLKSLYDDSEINIGTAVHMMAELEMKGRPQKDIDFYLTTSLKDDDQRAKANIAFAAFRKWRDEFHVYAHTQEVSLISEKLQFGGTIDTIAVIRNGLALLDFKTSAAGEIYEDMVLQLAGYGILWNENHPEEPLTSGYHLIVLPKDGSSPVHREFTHDQLNPFRQKFWLYRKALEFESVCADPQVLAGRAVIPSPKPETKPRVRVAVQRAPATMAEILRTYGHLEGVPT